MLRQIARRVLLVSVGSGWLAGICASAAEPDGKVETTRGECFAQNAAERRSLQPAADLFVGDAVSTGVQSALAMRLGASTEVKLGAQAQLRIDRYLVNAGGVLVLERGAMLYDHDASGGPADTTVRTPFGLVAVRGTRFFAGPSNDVFGVFVERGSVIVIGAGKAVLVVSGFGTNIARPGAEPTSPTKWGAARITSAMQSVS